MLITGKPTCLAGVIATPFNVADAGVKPCTGALYEISNQPFGPFVPGKPGLVKEPATVVAEPTKFSSWLTGNEVFTEPNKLVPWNGTTVASQHVPEPAICVAGGNGDGRITFGATPVVPSSRLYTENAYGSHEPPPPGAAPVMLKLDVNGAAAAPPPTRTYSRLVGNVRTQSVWETVPASKTYSFNTVLRIMVAEKASAPFVHTAFTLPVTVGWLVTAPAPTNTLETGGAA